MMDEVKEYFEKKAREKDFECIDDNKYMFWQRFNYVKNALGNIKCKKVLDLGCGPGYYSMMLIKRGADVTCFDLAINMLKRLPKECKKRVCGTATSLNFKDDSFDRVINIEMLQYLNKKDSIKCLKEIYRVLKKDGKLIMTTIAGDWKNVLFFSWL
jgi:ubiquinone/menaquinone biosynthesis C-methylase UbiE